MPLYSPSSAPKASGEKPSWTTRYKGSTLATISDDKSVRRLVAPRNHTFGGTDRHARPPTQCGGEHMGLDRFRLIHGCLTLPESGPARG